MEESKAPDYRGWVLSQQSSKGFTNARRVGSMCKVSRPIHSTVRNYALLFRVGCVWHIFINSMCSGTFNGEGSTMQLSADLCVTGSISLMIKKNLPERIAHKNHPCEYISGCYVVKRNCVSSISIF